MKRALREGEKLTRPGLPIIDICETVEACITNEGAQPAFPCNVSVNEIAAHYTSPPGDTATIPEHAIVKIDAGAHMDGYIVDKAISVSTTQKLNNLVRVAEKALKNALKFVKPGIRVSLIGKIIETTIRSYGFKPIINLSGHQIKRYQLHAGKTIPNFNAANILSKVKPGEVYAIEPFATNGVGLVVAARNAYIYRVLNPKQLPETLASKLGRQVSLPFAARWIKDVDYASLQGILKNLTKKGIIASYPVLIEKSGGLVAQFETTILITEDSFIPF